MHPGETTLPHPASRQVAIVAELSPLVQLQGASAVLADSTGFAKIERAQASQRVRNEHNHHHLKSAYITSANSRRLN